MQLDISIKEIDQSKKKYTVTLIAEKLEFLARWSSKFQPAGKTARECRVEPVDLLRASGGWRFLLYSLLRSLELRVFYACRLGSTVESSSKGALTPPHSTTERDTFNAQISNNNHLSTFLHAISHLTTCSRLFDALFVHKSILGMSRFSGMLSHSGLYIYYQDIFSLVSNLMVQKVIQID